MIGYKDIIGCTGSYLGAKRIGVRVSSLLILSVIVLVPVEFCNLPFWKICLILLQFPDRSCFGNDAFQKLPDKILED